jgi:flagellar motor switch protein FliG
VTAAQQEILKLIRDLVDKGDIQVGGAAQQMV